IVTNIAVALYATSNRRVNSLLSRSERSSPPKIPIASVTTANIGTPSTNAANIRCTSAAIHTAARAPMRGNSPYAWLVSAAAWSRRRASGIRNPAKQILRSRAFRALAQDDKRGRSLERGRRTHRFSFLSSHEATERVFLSAEGAKDLLVGSIHRSRKTASVSRNRSAKLAEPPRAARG